MRPRTARAALASLLSFGALAAGTLAACSAPAVSGHFIGGVAGTTITLEGPNQWTQSGSSFGPPWAQVVAEFKKVTGVTVNTDVLPLATFSSVESAQLAAGIAPDLVFNQATYQPYMVVPLNKYLSQPNPFVAGQQKLALGVRPVGLLGEGHRGARLQGELRLGAIQPRRHCHVLQQERLQAGRDHRADQHLLAADRRLRGTREGRVHADGDGQLRDRDRTSPTGRSSIS